MRTFIVQIALLAASAFVPATAVPPGREVSPNPADVAARSLERRNGEIYCGNFAAGDGDMARHLVDNLRNNNWHTISPHGCYRAQCKDTTAVYVCNDNSYTLNVHGNEITKHADNILNGCCMYSADKRQIYGDQMAGQQFTDAVGGNWNVVIGYGNCNHPSTEKPSAVGGWGVNGPGCQRLNWYIG